ncbi:MAG: O-antigen ligase family protein [Gemmatimonadota bacterium]
MKGPARLGADFYAAMGFMSVAAVVMVQAAGGSAVYVGAVLAAVWALFISFRSPLPSLRSGVFLFLVAGTEFRTRDPLAGVEGSVDTQIVFELAIYGFVAWVTFRALIRLPRHVLRIGVFEALVLAYVLLAAASVLWSPIGTYTLIRALQLAVLLAYALVAVRTLGPGETWKVLARSIVTFTGVFAVLGTLASAIGIYDPPGSRFGWFSTHPIAVGSFAAVAGLVVLSDLLFGNRTRPRRGLRLLGLMALIAILVATVSRGPLVAFLLSAGVLVAMRIATRAVASLAIVAGTAVALVILNLPGGMFTVLDQLIRIPGFDTMLRGQSAQELFTLTGRIELWKSLYPAFLEQPLVGHGYQVTRIVGVRIAPWAGEAHNGLLQSLVDVGLLGTVLLLGALVGTIVVNYSRVVASAATAPDTAIRASMCGALLFLFVNSVGTAGFAGAPGFEPLLLFVAAAVTLRISRREAFEGSVTSGAWSSASE